MRVLVKKIFPNYRSATHFNKTFFNFSVNMRYVYALFLFLSFAAQSQILQDVNYNFLYEPDEPFRLEVKTVRTAEGWRILYHLTLQDSTQLPEQFLLKWDLRKSLSDKEGQALDPSSIQNTSGRHGFEGIIKLDSAASPQVLVAKVLNNSLKRVWVSYKFLEPGFPVNGYLMSGNSTVVRPYVKTNTPLSISAGGKSIVISHYKDDFPAAVPPFSEGMGKVSRGMRVDTTYRYPTNTDITFADKGLYLVQLDTSDVNGFAFRVEDDYPRFAKVESLADPLIYVCTKQEFDRIKAAKGDKRAFDKVILSITGSADRARNFMRNYFRRVEWANYYFTSYKEGWKTDRGMIYILFGLPDEIFRFSDREVWHFDNKNAKATFNFARSSTIFDPDNYVLIRDKKFQETWYEKIDLWRNARF